MDEIDHADDIARLWGVVQANLGLDAKLIVHVITPGGDHVFVAEHRGLGAIYVIDSLSPEVVSEALLDLDACAAVAAGLVSIRP